MEATRGDVSELKQENEQIKLVVAELVLRNRVVNKSLLEQEVESTWDS